jgi:hypothetical protein
MTDRKRSHLGTKRAEVRRTSEKTSTHQFGCGLDLDSPTSGFDRGITLTGKHPCRGSRCGSLLLGLRHRLCGGVSLAELGLAQLDKALDLLPIEIFVTHERVADALPLDEAMAPEDTPDHVLGDVLVVLDLTLVVGEDGSGDVLGRSPAASAEQGHEHDGLVNVRHPHAVVYEVRELLVSHANTVRKPESRRYRFISRRLREGVAAESKGSRLADCFRVPLNASQRPFKVAWRFAFSPYPAGLGRFHSAHVGLLPNWR